MRRIKLTSPRVYGSGQVYDAGDEIEVAAEEADALVRAGQAVDVPTTTTPTTRSGRRG